MPFNRRDSCETLIEFRSISFEADHQKDNRLTHVNFQLLKVVQKVVVLERTLSLIFSYSNLISLFSRFFN